MELKLLLKNTIHLAGSKILTFFVGLIRAKINALFLGTEGLGIISQIQFTNLQLQKFTLLGMNDGLVKQIASRKNNENFKELFVNSLKSYLVIISYSFFFAVLLLICFSHQLTVYFFGDIKYLNYYLISLMSLPILIINSFSYAILKSFKEVKAIANGEIFTTIVSFILFVPLVYYFKLTGAVIVLLIALIVALFYNQMNAKKNILLPKNITTSEILKGKISVKDLKELFVFAGFGLTIGLYQMFTEISARSIVVTKIGINSLGLYAPNQSWGGLFTGMILPTVFTYLYPRFSEAKSESEITYILNDVLRLISFIMVPFLYVGIGFRQIIIPFFYSQEFVGSSAYLPGHFIGVLFSMWMFCFSQVFTPTGRIRIYVFFSFILYSLNIAIVYLLIDKLGLMAWMLKFLIPPIIFFFVFYYYLRKKMNFVLFKENKKLMFVILIQALVLYFINEKYRVLSYFLSILFMTSTLFMLKSTEYNYLKQKINKSIFRFKK